MRSLKLNRADDRERLDPQEVAALFGTGPVYFVCRSGTRSQKACEKLQAAGIKEVISVEGGTVACEAAGVPVVRGQKVMSLERQVRITAGVLVSAGLTDTCGMGMLIARMPWNQACRSATT